MQTAMLGPPGPAPPPANAPGIALGHQLSTPGSRPTGPPGPGETFAETIAAALAAAQSGAMQIGNASQPEESHGASLLARLLLGSSGGTKPEGDVAATAGETTQPDRPAGVGMTDGLDAAAVVAADLGADVGAAMLQQARASTVVTSTDSSVIAAPAVTGAADVIARQAAASVDVVGTGEAAAMVVALPVFGDVPDGEPAAPMAKTPVVTPGGDGPTDDVERLTYEAPGKSVTRGNAGDAPRSALAMVSAVIGEPGRAAEAHRLDRGVVERLVEASASAAADATAGEVQPPAAPLAALGPRGAVAANGAASVDGPQLAGRIAETVQSAVMRGDSEVRLVLNPPQLGRVDIRIVDTPDGLVVAMRAANGEARELISRSLVSLQAALEGRELRVDRLTVDQPSQQSQDEPGWQGQRGEDGRQRGWDEESNGDGFGGSDGEAHDASPGTQPSRRVDAPAGGRHDGALNLVA